MKLKKIGQLSLAAIVSLVLLCGSTSCRQDFTTAFVFAVGTQYNQIGSYKESDETGALSPAPGSPFGSGGTNPIRTFVLSGGRYLYVLNQGAAQTDANGNTTYTGANISLFSIGGNGTLAFQASYTSQGLNSLRFLPDTTGKFLFVQDSYAPISTTSVTPQANPSAEYPCQGSDGKFYPTGDITVFSIDPNTGRLSIVTNQQQQNANGTQLTYFPVGCAPVDFTVASGFIFTAEAGGPANNFHADDRQTVFPYQLNATNGQLTLTQNSPLAMGTTNMTSISTAQGSVLSGSKYVYILDAGQGQNCTGNVCSGEILPFTAGTNGSLQALTNGAVANDTTASNPTSLVVDSKGKYLFVVNAGPTTGIVNPISQITGWTIDPTNGTLQHIAGEPFGSGSGVNCIFEDTSSQYIYTSSFNDSQITGRILDPNTGNLTLLRRGSTFNVVGNPTWCAISGRTT
jgi:6-phosphogluconolactonase (cycloisomerase 2 family)